MNGFAPRVFSHTLPPQTVSRPGDMPAATPAAALVITSRLVSVPPPLFYGGVGVGSAPDLARTSEMIGGPGGHGGSDGNRNVGGGGGSSSSTGIDEVCELELRTVEDASGGSVGSTLVHRRRGDDRVGGGDDDNDGESGGGSVSPRCATGWREASLEGPQPPDPGAVGGAREGGEQQMATGGTVAAVRRHPEYVGAGPVLRATVADVEAAAEAALEADERSREALTADGDYHACYAIGGAGDGAVRMTIPTPPVPVSMVLPTTNNGRVAGWLPPSSRDNHLCSGSPRLMGHQRSDGCGGGGVRRESGGSAAAVSGGNAAAAVSSSARRSGDDDAHLRVVLVGGGCGGASLERMGIADGGGGLPHAPPSSAPCSAGGGGLSSNGHLGPYAIGSASSSGVVYGTNDVALAPPEPGVVDSGGNDGGGGSGAGVGVDATAEIGAGSLRVVKVAGNGRVFHGADNLHSTRTRRLDDTNEQSSRTRKLGDTNEQSSRTRELPLGRESPPVADHVAPTTANNGCQPGQAAVTAAPRVTYLSRGPHSPRPYRRGAAVTTAEAAAALYTATHHPHVSSPDATLYSADFRLGGSYISTRGRVGAGPGGDSRGGPGRGTDGRSLERAAPSGVEGRGGAGSGGAVVGYGLDMSGRSILAGGGGSSSDGCDGSGSDVNSKKRKAKGPYADVGFVSWRSGGSGSCSNVNSRTAGCKSRGQQVPVAPPPALAAFKPPPAANALSASSTVSSSANGGRNRGGHGTTKLVTSRDGSSGQHPRPGPGRPRSSTATYEAPASVVVSKNGPASASSPSSESTASASAAACPGSFAATAGGASAAATVVSGVGGTAAATTMMMTMSGGRGAVTGAVAAAGNFFQSSVADSPGLRDTMDVVVDAAAAVGQRTSPRLMHVDAAGNIGGACYGGVDNRTVGDLAAVGPGSLGAVANSSAGALVTAQDGESSHAREGGGSGGGGGGTAGFVNAVRSAADSGMKVVLRRG
ncbi:unnamed protein product [Sphacelaria rigidula]